MRTVGGGLRYALRGLVKSPLFSLIAISSLAMGIGANTAIFTLLDQLLLRLLPVKDPQELVLLTWRGTHVGSNTGSNALSYPMYKDFRDQNQVFSGMLCRYGLPLSVSFQGQTERAEGELVSGNYFQLLGVGAAIGRVISPGDDVKPGGHPIAVLSYDYWQARFGADPAVVGRDLSVNGMPLTVIGVSQRGFEGIEPGSAPKIRIPVMMKRQMTPGLWADLYNLENRRGRWVQVFGRLKPGMTLTQAKASLQPLFHAMLARDVQDPMLTRMSAYTRGQFLKSWMDVLPAAKGRSMLRRQYETPLWVLMAIVALVLLIAGANVANLMMARATGRQKEIGVRLAMGAGRARIVRQLVTESLLLSLMGGAAGLLFAAWADRLLVKFIPAGDSGVPLSTSPDVRVLLFTLAIATASGVLFGMAPAFQSMRVDVAAILKEQAGAVLGGGSARLRKGLVIAQVFLSVVLLIGAGLFLRSLRNLQTLDPGFSTARLAAFSLNPMLNGYTRDRALLFYRELQQRLVGIRG